MNILKFKQDEKLQSITDKLPFNQDICESILKLIGNTKTKVVLDKDIKNSYYVYLNNTIYLADNYKSNTLYSRLCLIAHECRHSVQNKTLQKLNFIFSNLEIFAFVIFSLIVIFNTNMVFCLYSYVAILVLSIIFRLYLETDATIQAPKIVTKYLKTVQGSISIEDQDICYAENVYKKYTKQLYPLFIFLLFLGKLLRLMIILVIYNLK